jgi:hypothetical protein
MLSRFPSPSSALRVLNRKITVNLIQNGAVQWRHASSKTPAPRMRMQERPVDKRREDRLKRHVITDHQYLRKKIIGHTRELTVADVSPDLINTDMASMEKVFNNTILRAFCIKNHIPSSGTKRELIKRIVEFWGLHDYASQSAYGV